MDARTVARIARSNLDLELTTIRCEEGHGREEGRVCDGLDGGLLTREAEKIKKSAVYLENKRVPVNRMVSCVNSTLGASTRKLKMEFGSG